MKKNKGFTLIELLAVIVILAVIALIAVPQVIKILNKSRISAAEDSAYGIVKSAESYVANFMLNNDGSMPSKNLEFECSNSGCVLKTTDLRNYDLTDLNELSFKGVKPKSGTVTIEDNGQTIKASNLEINGFKCNYPNNEGKVSCEKGTNSDDNLDVKDKLENRTYTSGEAITNFGGYNWHVIGDDGTNVTLLMDAGQIKDMAHCGSNNDSSNNCTFNGSHYVYSWDKSIINSYLKNTLYPTIKDKIENIVPVSVCIDPSRGDGVATYGGYLQSEIDKISEASCSKTETDYVRLITYSEYWNLSPYYSEKENASYPNVSGITKLSSESDYANWLYCNSNKCGRSSDGYWWTMASSSHSYSSHVRLARFVHLSGSLNVGELAFGVRPVITVRK